MDYYGHKLSNGVLFAHHLILDVPGGSSHLGYRRRVPFCHNPHTRVKAEFHGHYLSCLVFLLACLARKWRCWVG